MARNGCTHIAECLFKYFTVASEGVHNAAQSATATAKGNDVLRRQRRSDNDAWRWQIPASFDKIHNSVND